MIEGGGWVGVGDEYTRIAAGEAAVWPADIPHAAWTEHSEMRAIVVELAGADDRDSVIGRARRRRWPTPDGRPVSWGTGRLAADEPDRRRTGRRVDRGRAGLVERRCAPASAAEFDQLFEKSHEAVAWSVAGRPSSSRATSRIVAQVAGRRAAARAEDLRGRRHDGVETEGRIGRREPRGQVAGADRRAGAPTRATRRAPSSAAGPSRGWRRARHPVAEVEVVERGHRVAGPDRARRPRSDRGTGRRRRPGSRSR